MPLRSVKMNRFIFGFQRRVWCPKWTPLSSSCFMLTTAIAASLFCARPPAAHLGSSRAPGGAPPWRPAAPRTRRLPAGTEVATAPRWREEDARSHPVGTGRTGKHTRRRPALSPADRPVHRWRSGGPSGARPVESAHVIARLGIVVLLVCAGVVAPAPATAEPVRAAATALWVRPLPSGPVARPFQPPPSPYAAGHRGVDLAGAPRAPVSAAGDGVVVFAGMVAGRPVVSIDHAGGLRTTYEPVDAAVGAGQPVARGSPLGELVA